MTSKWMSHRSPNKSEDFELFVSEESSYKHSESSFVVVECNLLLANSKLFESSCSSLDNFSIGSLIPIKSNSQRTDTCASFTKSEVESMAELESFSSCGTLPNKVQPKYVYIATSPEDKTFRCPVISRPKTSAPMSI
ncbi:hypothetical protein CDAR_439521 [Caerostris darwini]|uniref:Uncharacterized protein n=1 Tax=Caerostris darwini TaxID=1538125 RepID=A0AAV4MJE2_9ARAC|nr:hypothetical protein CDAR_439521 [Caerostris darwini]